VRKKIICKGSGDVAPRAGPKTVFTKTAKCYKCGGHFGVVRKEREDGTFYFVLEDHFVMQTIVNPDKPGPPLRGPRRRL
jgi:hypothetical protein